MKRNIFNFAIVSIVVFFAGCLSPKTSGVVVEKGRLIVHDASFALNLDMVSDTTQRTPEGFLRVQAKVRNTNHVDFRCQYRFEWKTPQGVVQTHALAPWRPVVLHGRDETVLEAVSLVPGADDFRLILRRIDD
ncbi:MAG: YcfL family protein [Kiritimatiellae bacterium]|nr:YcfL family protein [Kiritimatiellia bacterium]